MLKFNMTLGMSHAKNDPGHPSNVFIYNSVSSPVVLIKLTFVYISYNVFVACFNGATGFVSS